MKCLSEELYEMVCPHENVLELAANWSWIGRESLPFQELQRSYLCIPWRYGVITILWVDLPLASHFELGWEEEESSMKERVSAGPFWPYLEFE